MQVTLFHLMPYAEVDIAAARAHGTVWGLPNKHYDPQVAHRLYNRFLDELEYGETLGFDAVSVNGHGLDRWEAVAERDQGTEALLMGLRLTEGVELARVERLLEHAIPAAKIASLTSQGFLARDAGRLRATPKGRLVLNAILKELVA